MKEGIDYLANPNSVEKVVLLYSGGLDTSCMVKWIQEQYDADVVTLTIDLGQPGVDLQKAKEKALDQGAESAFVIDAKEEFAKDYVSKAIKANGLYQEKYPLSTAIARYLKCKKAVEVAKKVDADAIAHGATGKGNDQVRFEAGIMSLDPDLKLLAPVRQWSMTRDKEIEYAEKHGIDVEAEKGSPYSTDENLWGKSSECGPLEYPDKEPPGDVFQFVNLPEEAPEEPAEISITFEEGVPTALNGEEMQLHSLVEELNSIAGKHGVGIIDMMEDRVVGLKSREIYECPAATAIIEAHKDLEKYVSTKHENSFKKYADKKWAEMAYSGLWFDPLMHHLNSLVDSMNSNVSGKVYLKLYKGSAQVIGRESEEGLYNHQLASYGEGETFNQEASPGFIQLWSLQTKMKGGEHGSLGD
ncbi:MAG: argininosuccinate synthase [Candidatus Nanohaloarchaeota archaeon QJJ-9]|nr:argininosuccinate synthase [Candidatus Nanohaloarchaeota archaeon QJJ-9]